MSREEAKKILGEEATEEQITNLLNQFHAIEKTKNDEIKTLNEKLNKFNDYDDIKKKLDDIEKANMTEQQKLEEDKRLTAENLKKSKMIVNKARATEILAGLGISDELIEQLVREDEEQTVANATALANQFKTMQEDTIKKTKEELAAIDVKPNITNVKQGSDATMNWEKFTKLSVEEQNKFAEEHPEEFNNL